MSQAGQPNLEPVNGSHLRVVVVASRWHEQIMDGLMAGARRALNDAGVDARVIVRAPGSFELPIVVQELTGEDFDAIVALGVVIRGGTPHFDYICSSVAQGLMSVSLDTRVPVGFGVLTCDTEEQARDRAGLEGSSEDKGYEVTHAAISTALILKDIRPDPV